MPSLGGSSLQEATLDKAAAKLDFSKKKSLDLHEVTGQINDTRIELSHPSVSSKTPYRIPNLNWLVVYARPSVRALGRLSAVFRVVQPEWFACA